MPSRMDHSQLNYDQEGRASMVGAVSWKAVASINRLETIALHGRRSDGSLARTERHSLRQILRMFTDCLIDGLIWPVRVAQLLL